MNDHSHSGHSHSHAPKDFGFAFALGTALNLGFVAIEAVFGVLANSTALLADAGHNLSDVIGLLIAWGAAVLAKRPATERFTYGLRGTSILAALANALLLMLACGAIAWEAVWRFAHPKPVEGMTVIVVAAIGILVNGFTAWLFMAGRKSDLNIRGAYLHMVADAGVSLGVVVAGVAILLTGWLWLDPLVSLVIVAVILWSTYGLLRDSIIARARCGASAYPAFRREILPRKSARRHRGASCACLGHEHERGGAHRPSGDAGRTSRQRVLRAGRARSARALRHRPPDIADRDRGRPGPATLSRSMMPKSVKRFSDYIMLQVIGIDHVYDFGSTRSKVIVIDVYSACIHAVLV